MKKAKIILASLVVLAFIGGAFAFKATKFTGLFAWQPTVGTITFTTAANGPLYTAANIAYCTTTASVTFLEPFPGAPTTQVRTLPVAGQITGTAVGGATTTLAISYKTCANLTTVYTTNAE